jgi:hypothetical protein
MIIALTLAAVALAGLMTGLWLGERGRRRAAESYLVYGTTNTLGKAVTRLPETAEDRYQHSISLHAQNQRVSQETIERFYTDAKRELDAQGIPYDPEKLRADIANHLVYGEDVLE